MIEKEIGKNVFSNKPDSDNDNSDHRVVSSLRLTDEVATDVTFRPQNLSEYIGQSRAKENMEIFIQAARQRGDALDHILLYGPPGLGKTTLVNIIAIELGVSIKATYGPVIYIAGDF